jgi:serine O-acetyltransferase
MPSGAVLVDLVESLRSALFPGYFGASELSEEATSFHVGVALDRVLRSLPEQIQRGFSMIGDGRGDHEKDALAITHEFLASLPRVQVLLATDVQAAFEGDPAATCPEETIFCYPGMLAVTYHRLAHELYTRGAPLIPRIMSEHAHGLTGIDIHPGATIGESFFIDHGTGVVIGETTIIGKRVRLYQGVTLGAKSFPKDEHGNPIKGIPRHPIVEDNVVIYAGATILGRVTVGRGSVIGGSVWLTHSVPPGTVLSQAMERSDSSRRG